MVASRNRPEGGLGTPFGLGVLMLLLLSSEVGRQDLAALLARQPIVDRSQKAAFASPFGTIHEAKFSVAHAMGDSIPLPLDFKLIGFDPNDPGVTGSIRERFLGEEAFFISRYAGPMVDRSRKGDYGVARDRLLALKGDRLKPTRRADVDDERQGPSLAQQEPGQPLAIDPPVGIADAATDPTRPALPQPGEDAGRYSLASAGDYRAAAIAPKRSEVNSAYPVLAPQPEGGAEAGKTGEDGKEGTIQGVTSLAFAAADTDSSLRAARLYFSI